MSFNPEQEYLIISLPIDIRDFHEYSDDFIVRPPYQRKNVWSSRKKQNLLDSLFRRYYIPKIVIREIRLNEEKTLREIIDGQQRINTVQEFFSNEIKLPKSLEDIHADLPGKFYKDLGSEFRRFIDRELKYEADIVKGIENPKNPVHQKVATEIFWRLQQGAPLNFMEVAHANLASLSRNIIVKHADDITFDFVNYRPIDSNPDKHNFFKIIKPDNERMQHLLYFTRFLIIEESNGYCELGDKFVTEFIEKYEREDGVGNCSLENENFVRDTLSTMNLFYEIFKEDPILDEKNGIKELRTEYIVLSFYFLLRHLRKYYAINENLKNIFKEFLVNGFYERNQNTDDSDNDMLLFKANRQQSTNNLQTRDQVLRQMFFEYSGYKGVKLLLKDERRAFNEAEKIKIYRRDKGLCQLCLSEGKNEREARVSWSSYEADHIFPHTLGGQTITDNGQVLCQTHNRRKSAGVR
jgi:hypothetical protein